MKNQSIKVKIIRILVDNMARIALVGTRGLPPNYGGYETFADNFVKHMVPRGHEVIVACEKPRKANLPNEYFGAKLAYFPTRPPRIYSLRKIYEGLNDLYFYIKLARKCDIMYILSGMGTQAIRIIRLLNPKIKIVTSSDGLEWQRSKHSFFERVLIKSFTKSSLKHSDLIVHDHPHLEEVFPKHDKNKAVVINNGVEIPPSRKWDETLLQKVSNLPKELKSGEYWMIVARLQKDNNTHTIIEGFVNSESNFPLLVVGGVWDSGYGKVLEKLMKSDSRKRVFMLGGIYDLDILDMLREHSTGIIHGHSAGGTNPSLLEAMAMRRYVLAHDNQFNRFVLDDVGDFFSDSISLSSIINRVEKDKSSREKCGEENFERIVEMYLWERCFDSHEEHFLRILDS